MKKKIIVSAINLREGGALSILNDCLKYLDKELSSSYEIVALVHKKDIIISYKNIKFIEFPNSIDSYFLRLYYEYFYFKKLSKKLKPYLWLSLHDITPNVYTDIQAVYCHNPSPFYNITLKEAILEPKFALFSIFYKYLYQINIKNNNYVIVQQQWLADKFKNIYSINNIIISNPNVEIDKPSIQDTTNISNKITFIYPAFPRVFKNFEVICDAVRILNESKATNHKFEVILTIDGTENSYSNMIVQKYKHLDSIKFIGIQSREQVFNLYERADCLIFPSKLETWGLPITEFKLYNKPIIAADLPYAHETVGNYDKAVFFEYNNSNQLSSYIESFLLQKLKFTPNTVVYEHHLTGNSWAKLFNIILG